VELVIVATWETAAQVAREANLGQIEPRVPAQRGEVNAACAFPASGKRAAPS